MLDNQLTMDVSPYSSLYDIVVPKTHFLRQLIELCDFSFIYDELEKNYRPDFGRKAYSPIMMFKYLLLKDIYKLSDVDVVGRSLSDMAFKFFLGLAPEDSVIEPSSLTKFRKLRIKDDKLLDVLIQKSVQIALEHNLIKSKILIVDATHTKSHYNHKKPQEILRERSKALRKTIYQHSEDIKIEFPKKPQEDNLEAELTYTEELMAVVEKHEELLALPAVSQKFNYLKEAVEDDLEHLEASVKEEARLGHKTADTSFYGYKSHIAMTDERIITACVVTSGEQSDGKYLPELYAKTKENSLDIETIIGHEAYSGKNNIQLTRKEKIHLVSKLNPSVFQKVTVKKRMRLNLIKTQGYLSVQKDTWLFAKQGQGKNIKIRIKLSLITLTLKSARIVFPRKGVIRREQSLKLIHWLLRVTTIFSRRNFRKHLILKKWPDIAIKSKRRMPN